MSKKALLIVDVQNDFCPGGALAVKDGDAIVETINRLMDKFDVIIASQDWHPAETVHFKQWPKHCVHDSSGAQLHAKLDVAKIDQRFLKGTADKDDGYSAFEATNANLFDYLKARNVIEVYVVGLATDYCVKASALDAVKKGFKTFVIADAVKGVNLQAGDVERAYEIMQKAGVGLLDSQKILSS